MVNNLEYQEKSFLINAKPISIESFAMDYLNIFYDFVLESKNSLHHLKDILTEEKLTHLSTNKKGMPDLIAIKDSKIIFYEIKSETDSLRTHQLNWIKENPDFKVIVLTIKFNIKKDLEESLRSKNLEDYIKRLEDTLETLTEHNKSINNYYIQELKSKDQKIKELDEELRKSKRFPKNDLYFANRLISKVEYNINLVLEQLKSPENIKKVCEELNHD